MFALVCRSDPLGFTKGVCLLYVLCKEGNQRCWQSKEALLMFAASIQDGVVLSNKPHFCCIYSV